MTLLKFLTQETDTTATTAPAAAAALAEGDEGVDNEPARGASKTPFSLVTVLRFTWASSRNWPEIARKARLRLLLT